MRKKSRITRNPREAAVYSLNKALESEFALDEILKENLKHIKEPDYSLGWALALGTARRLNTLDWVLFRAGKLKHLDGDLANILRVAAFQIIFMDRIPDYAAVDSAVRLARREKGPRAGGFANAVLRKVTDIGKNGGLNDECGRAIFLHSNIRETYKPGGNGVKRYEEYLSAHYSLPDFMVKRLRNRLGLKGLVRYARAVNREAPHYIRINRLKTDRENLTDKLAELGVQAIPGPVKDILEIDNLKGITESEVFNKGWFYIQDAASAMVSHAVGPVGNCRVLDYCASPGGKASHLAELSGGSAIIVAHDRPERLQRLRENIKRLKTPSIKVTSLLDNEKPFNIVLVDAPCSGSGTINRHPELKWKLENRIKTIPDIQLEILMKASEYLAEGGDLYYSTCSLEPEENEKVIEKFVNESDFHMVPLKSEIPHTDAGGFIRTWPHIHRMDGFSMFRLKK